MENGGYLGILGDLGDIWRYLRFTIAVFGGYLGVFGNFSPFDFLKLCPHFSFFVSSQFEFFSFITILVFEFIDN